MFIAYFDRTFICFFTEFITDTNPIADRSLGYKILLIDNYWFLTSYTEFFLTLLWSYVLGGILIYFNIFFLLFAKFIVMLYIVFINLYYIYFVEYNNFLIFYSILLTKINLLFYLNANYYIIYTVINYYILFKFILQLFLIILFLIKIYIILTIILIVIVNYFRGATPVRDFILSSKRLYFIKFFTTCVIYFTYIITVFYIIVYSIMYLPLSILNNIEHILLYKFAKYFEKNNLNCDYFLIMLLLSWYVFIFYVLFIFFFNWIIFDFNFKFTFISFFIISRLCVTTQVLGVSISIFKFILSMLLYFLRNIGIFFNDTNLLKKLDNILNIYTMFYFYGHENKSKHIGEFTFLLKYFIDFRRKQYIIKLIIFEHLRKSNKYFSTATNNQLAAILYKESVELYYYLHCDQDAPAYRILKKFKLKQFNFLKNNEKQEKKKETIELTQYFRKSVFSNLITQRLIISYRILRNFSRLLQTPVRLLKTATADFFKNFNFILNSSASSRNVNFIKILSFILTFLLTNLFILTFILL